jgi:hypothetical protein
MKSIRFLAKGLAVAVAAVISTLAGVTIARASTFTCTPTGVGIFAKQRVHVRCTPTAPGGIGFFAFSLKKKEAPLMLEVFTSAKAQGKNLVIYYDPNDLSGPKIGCATADCRVLIGAEIQQ